MNSGDYRVTALLTEHLGFAPLTLIDEVINSVNHIMYTCTDALEEFLEKRRNNQLEELQKQRGKNDDSDVLMENSPESSHNENVFPLDEIRLGTAELETLLVSHVDKNFDKFELYTLRNILTIPRDLVEDGYIRLKHHADLDPLAISEGSKDSSSSDSQIKTLVTNINLELQLRKILQIQKSKASKLVGLLKHYKECLLSIMLAGANSTLTPEVKNALRQHLEPVNENIYFLLSQVDELLQQVLKLNDKLKTDPSFEGIKDLAFTPSNRDLYIQNKSLKILDEIGVLGENSSKVVYSAYAHTENKS